MSQEYKLERSQATGIVRDQNGIAFIPATQRPDGTWRKAQRVKAGYIPEEDQKKYETAASRNRRLGVIPGMSRQMIREQQMQPAVVIHHQTSKNTENMTKMAKKNLKRSQQRAKKREEKAAAEIQQQYKCVAGGDEMEEVTQRLATASITSSLSDNKKQTEALLEEKKEDPARRIKAIRKKLRQIDDLQAKIVSGELTNPDSTQLEKISKRSELVEELDKLEKLS